MDGRTQKGDSPPDESNRNSAELDLLRSRFAALSRVAASSTLSKIPPQSVFATPGGSQECSEIRLDHHAPPHDDLHVIRKRQKGPQHIPKFSLRQSSVPRALNPLASPFGGRLVGLLNDPVPAVTDTETNFSRLAQKPSRGFRGGKTRAIKKHLAARQFLGHFYVSDGTQESEEDKEAAAETLARKSLQEDAADAEVGKRIRNIKIEDIDEEMSFHFEPETQMSEEDQSHANPTRIGSFVGQFDVSNISIVKTAVPKVEAVNLELKNGGAKSKELPGAVLIRYPRMAKYLNTLTAQDSSMRRIVSAPPTVRDTITVQPSVLQQKPKEEKVGDTKGKGPVVFAPENENAKHIGGREALYSVPLIPAPIDGRKTTHTCTQGDTAKFREDPVSNLGNSTEATPSGNKLKKPRLAAQYTKFGPSVSSRPALPPRYAIPVRAQINEWVDSKATAKSGYGVSGMDKTRRPSEEDPVMEQLALIDERFSRESEGTFFPSDLVSKQVPDFCLSQSSSGSNKGNIVASISSDILKSQKSDTTSVDGSVYESSALMSASKEIDEITCRDSDRFRRSMSPSPSPSTARLVGTPIDSFAKIFTGESSMDNSHVEKSENQGNQWNDIAGNWLERFSNSAKPASLPRNQPSVVARMQQASSSTNMVNLEANDDNYDKDGDSDGVAPGEWIQPVGLPKKKPVKPKIGITAALAPLLLRSEPHLDMGLAPRSIAGSGAGGSQNNKRTNVAVSQSNYPNPKIFFSESSLSINEKFRDAIATRNELAEANSKREEAEEAEDKEKVIREWRERGFTEVGRVDRETLWQEEKQPMQKPSNPEIFSNESRESEAGNSANLNGKWKVPREGGLFASPPRINKANLGTRGRGTFVPYSGPIKTQNQTILGRGSSPVPIQSPALQQQLVDPNVQELADILRKIQTTQEVKLRSFLAPQIPKAVQASKAPQTQLIPRTPMAPQALVVPTANPIVFQTPAIRQALTVSPAPEAVPRRVSNFEQPVVSAYVRKLCPFFFAGRCTPGQNCPDLHPNYDEQSGTFADSRFMTQGAFEKEAFARAEKEKERGKALEALIKQSRDEADRKCHASVTSTTRQRTRNIQVASGIIVAHNAKGEQDWVINPPSLS